MYVNNRMVSMVYKVVLAVLSFLGLLMNTGIINGTFRPYMLLYYHNASNIFCLIFYIIGIVVLATRTRETEYGIGHYRPFAPHFKGGVVMAMMLTLLIYIFILALGNPLANAGALATISNILLNIVVPLGVLADWILFDKKGVFKPSDPYVWLVVPFAYYALVLIAAEPHLFNIKYYDGARYPYPFINPDIPGLNLGWARVLLHVALLTAAYIAVGYILLGIDRLLGDRAKKRAAEAIMVPEGDIAPGSAGYAAPQAQPARPVAQATAQPAATASQGAPAQPRPANMQPPPSKAPGSGTSGTTPPAGS